MQRRLRGRSDGGRGATLIDPRPRCSSAPTPCSGADRHNRAPSSISGQASRVARQGRDLRLLRTSPAARVESGARIGPFRPAAARRRDRVRRGGSAISSRSSRRRSGAGAQGQSSQLYRRCRDRRRGEYRRPARSPATMTDFTKTLTRIGEGRLHRLQHRAGRAAHDRRRRPISRRAARSPATSPPMRSPSAAASRSTRPDRAKLIRKMKTAEKQGETEEGAGLMCGIIGIIGKGAVPHRSSSTRCARLEYRGLRFRPGWRR